MDDHSEYLEAERQVLVEDIRSAFAGVSRSHGASWAGTEVDDMYGMVNADELFHDQDQTWEQLVDDPKWEVAPGIGGYAFLDVIGFRYYLPAAMIRCIRAGYDVGIGHWLTSHGRIPETWMAIDEGQRTVIARFLIYMAAVARWEDNEEMAKEWQAILDGDWAGPFPSPPLDAKTVKKRKKKAPPREVW
jgi:hypothetical protein